MPKPRGRVKHPNEKGEWKCCKCKTYLPATSFRPDKYKQHGLASWCRPCEAEKRRIWNAKRRYGLTQEMLEALPKQCEVCGREDKLHIDHNHKTGKVRGVLCNWCNTALGQLREDPQIALNLIDYMRRT